MFPSTIKLRNYNSRFLKNAFIELCHLKYLAYGARNCARVNKIYRKNIKSSLNDKCKLQRKLQKISTEWRCLQHWSPKRQLKMSCNTNTNINLNAIKSFEILSKTKITENPKQKQQGPI